MNRRQRSVFIFFTFIWVISVHVIFFNFDAAASICDICLREFWSCYLFSGPFVYFMLHMLLCFVAILNLWSLFNLSRSQFSFGICGFSIGKFIGGKIIVSTSNRLFFFFQFIRLTHLDWSIIIEVIVLNWGCGIVVFIDIVGNCRQLWSRYSCNHGPQLRWRCGYLSVAEIFLKPCQWLFFHSWQMFNIFLEWNTKIIS